MQYLQYYDYLIMNTLALLALPEIIVPTGHKPILPCVPILTSLQTLVEGTAGRHEVNLDLVQDTCGQVRHCIKDN